MAAAMRVEVVSPEKVLFSGEATQVITRTLSGEVAFLAGHAPFLGALAENHTRIYLADGTIQDVAVHRGFVEVSHDTVSILSDTAELSADIDVARARTARERAEEAIRRGDDDEAPAALARATARLNAAGATSAAH
jgi:F-type H+-transporting ATPase subunit epsilon